ncbi:serine hydrolase domain-containing protein [Egbenema bharatensis]|uniref:serine hydrolase domain-containing protein n=1 Tax=Egbenema bharatensis TaxID=3463334 RepID=UPI003A868677
MRRLLYLGLWIISITIALLLHPSRIQSQPSVERLDMATQIEQLAADYVMQRERVGLIVGLYQDGQIRVHGFGQGQEQNVPPDGNSVYEIGSITKVFTGITLAALEQQGQVTLDDPIADYLPPTLQLAPDVAAITLRQLATHTSGLPVLPDNLFTEATDEANPYRDYTARDLYLALEHMTLIHLPGRVVAYSNLGMGLLGHLLERRTNQPYETLVQDLLLSPLEMSDTTIALSPEQQQRRLPGHLPNGEITSSWDFDVLAPAGAFHSTANDMLRFIQASLTERDTPVSQAIARSQEPQWDNGEDEIGLAWQISSFPDALTVYWHNGGTGGYASFMGIDLEHQTGVILLSNYSDWLMEDDSLDWMGLALLQSMANPL